LGRRARPLLSAGVAYLLARGFSRRIDHLAEGARRPAAGEHAHRVSDHRHDELGELADAFNQMAEVLHSRGRARAGATPTSSARTGRLQEASRLKDEFLANTSHELRTPLNGILGFLSLVKDGVCDSHEEELDSVSQALECAQNLHGLIEDVLEVSRIEAGRLALSTQPVPVAPALERIALDMGPRAAARGLELRCEPPEEGLVVRADEQRLHQVLRHLIDNAIKFTHSGSILVTASAPEGVGHVRIAVRDTGVGVAPERQERLFERFVQGDGSATRKYGGTGLGLSLVRHLVEMMGGLVNLESAGLGHGTTVCFTLPLGGGATGATERPGAEAGTTANERSAHDALIRGPELGHLVLVVEDDPIASSWLEAVLQAGGMRTAHADSAERAWLLLRQLNPALVLADHALPHAASARLKSGCDLARHMREHRALEAVPVLLLTGMEPAWLEREGPLPANVTLLKKPVLRETLLATLRGLTPDAQLVRGLRDVGGARLCRRRSEWQDRRSLSPHPPATPSREAPMTIATPHFAGPDLDELVATRRDLHMHPELGFEEVRTSGVVAERLKKLGLEPKTGVGKTGVMARITGGKPGKTVLLRADMDALPIHEDNDVPYRSQHAGRMHACGHDCHTSILLGVARRRQRRD
jgi:signal transduction histidine kinase/CheY-like chemotaxis protein